MLHCMCVILLWPCVILSLICTYLISMHGNVHHTSDDPIYYTTSYSPFMMRHSIYTCHWWSRVATPHLYHLWWFRMTQQCLSHHAELYATKLCLCTLKTCWILDCVVSSLLSVHDATDVHLCVILQCLSLSDLLHLVWESMLLWMALFCSFYGWVVFYWVYVPHLLNPIVCWWTFGLLPSLSYCQ